MKLLVPLAALLALAACTVDLGTGTASRGPTPSGGAAGALGPNFCHSVPTDPRDRSRWNDLCFPGR